jgi:long-subunit acyl-CoA synthetase (AMP-forming)
LIPVGVYSTNNKHVCEYISRHSSAKVVVAENIELASKFFNLLETGEISKIVLYN